MSPLIKALGKYFAYINGKVYESLDLTTPPTTTTKGKDEMAKKANDLTPALVNSLKSSIHAVEVQITILKTLIQGDSDEAAKGTNMEALDEEGDDEEGDDEPVAKPAKKGKAAKAESFDDEDDAEEDAEDAEDEEEAKPAKKGKAAKAESFDDEDDAEEDAEDEEEAKPAKKGKVKKLTLDDVNDACKERARNSNRAEALGILKSKFKVKSVSDLKPEQYEAVIKAMKK